MNKYRQPKGADLLLRKARDRFNSLETQLAIREAVLDVEGITESDLDRVLDQLDQRKGYFKHIASFKAARVAMVEWAARQARLIARFRVLLLELRLSDTVAGLMLLRLPDYTGNEDDFDAWASERGEREEFCLSKFADIVTEHRGAVRSGIRKVLATCIGLGLDSRTASNEEREVSSYLHNDGPWSMAVDELESDVWMEVAGGELDTVINHPLPGGLLNLKAQYFARAWKTDRVREKEQDTGYSVYFDGLKHTVTEEGSERTKDAVSASFYDLHNSPFQLEHPSEPKGTPWTNDYLEQELRKAGPFRADGSDTAEPLPVAA